MCGIVDVGWGVCVVGWGWQIILTDPDGKLLVFDLAQPIVAGRAVTCDLVLTEKTVRSVCVCAVCAWT